MIRRNFLAGLMATVASAFILAGAEAAEPVAQTIKESRSIHEVLLSLPERHPGITKIKLGIMKPNPTEPSGLDRYGAIMDDRFLRDDYPWAQSLSDSVNITQNGLPKEKFPESHFDGVNATSWEIEVTDSEQMFRYYGTNFDRDQPLRA